MRVVSWNILAGGGSRCGPIVERLRRADADLIVLQETVASRGPDLCHLLAGDGYAHAFSAPRGTRDRGLCLLSRLPAVRIDGPPPPHATVYPRGWLEVELVGSAWRVAAVYGPSEGPALPLFWNRLSEWVRCRADRPFLMLGDFNAGRSRIDAPEYRFKAGAAFDRLTEVGLVDLWRREHGSRLEYTWYSRPPGPARSRGFRIDHAFASRPVARRVVRCRYDHTVRERGWSDHSLLELAVTAPRRRARELEY